jgi:predicted DCC family thiol-disulfide oxidoreductase YuxK
VFRLAPLESAEGRAALAEAGAPRDLPDSVILVDEAGLHARSEAALRVARRLGFPWSLAVLARAVPRPLRDRLYDAIARRR